MGAQTHPVTGEIQVSHFAETPPLARALSMTAFGVLALAWVTRIAIPTDPVQLFVWSWLAAIAWNIGCEPRHHLRFARDWALPFGCLLLYTYSRGLADNLGVPVHVRAPIVIDSWLGGGQIPTLRLQALWCAPDCRIDAPAHWYDAVFSAVYASHFFVAIVLAAVLWMRSRPLWLGWMRRYLTLCVMGLVGYVAYPMAPPWLASETGALAEPVGRFTGRGLSYVGERMSSIIGGPVGNSVAAMPSLHAGVAMLVALYGLRLLRRRWRFLLLVYPALMGLALVYFGEHYVIDLVAGYALALATDVGWARWEARRGVRLRTVETASGPEPAIPPATSRRRASV